MSAQSHPILFLYPSLSQSIQTFCTKHLPFGWNLDSELVLLNMCECNLHSKVHIGRDSALHLRFKDSQNPF